MAPYDTRPAPGPEPRVEPRYDPQASHGGGTVKILQHRDVLSIILAGGMGERLFPLTRDRAKPAVPFGGRYRIIDFALNNCVNSGLTKIKVMTQFKSNSLIEHIIRTWRLSFDIDQFVDPVPAQMRRGPHWFRGTADGRIVGFEEKPAAPRCIPGQPELALASMGNYIFRAGVLIEALEHDALQDTSHDFGREIIPALLAGGGRLFAYDFSTNRVPGAEDLAPYWRDVGTIDSYWDASMDLISVTPPLNLYNHKWPLKSHASQLPPAKFVFADAVSQRIGLATDSTVASGCIISGGTIHRSILFPRVRINSYSNVEECVLMDGVDVGRYARLRRVIVDRGVRIPPRT